jgi:beta-lactamase superfamily II metal-dependent hydrolase
MLKLRIVQAKFGDCFILEYGTPSSPRYMLIDGGPKGTYGDHLEGELLKISNSGGKLDLVLVSHVDNDHIYGVLELTNKLVSQQKTKTIKIKSLWHNAFNKTIDKNNDIQQRFNSLMERSYSLWSTRSASLSNVITRGISEGEDLEKNAEELHLEINEGFPQKLICVDDAPESKVFGNLRMRIVGPTRKNLDKLREEWYEYLQKEEAKITRAVALRKIDDRSVPNRSSIMVLAEAHGKRILLTGDGRGDHLCDGLEHVGLLRPGQNLHVDILKVPHHGSNRNTDQDFYRKITADKYIISADGTDDNPDLETLENIVKVAKEQDRNIEIIVTNETPSTRQLIKKYDPKEYNYRLTVMKKGSHSMTLDVAS